MPKNKTNIDSRPDELINVLIAHLGTLSPDTDEYAKTVDQLTKIYAIKTANANPDRLTKDTLAGIIANLLGIGMIVTHEHTHALTSKALGFIMKAKS